MSEQCLNSVWTLKSLPKQASFTLNIGVGRDLFIGSATRKKMVEWSGEILEYYFQKSHSDMIVRVIFRIAGVFWGGIIKYLFSVVLFSASHSPYLSSSSTHRHHKFSPLVLVLFPWQLVNAMKLHSSVNLWIASPTWHYFKIHISLSTLLTDNNAWGIQPGQMLQSWDWIRQNIFFYTTTYRLDFVVLLVVQRSKVSLWNWHFFAPEMSVCNEV